MKRILLIFMALGLVYAIQAQEKSISGTVTGSDVKDVLPMVNVYVEGGTGTTTNFEGQYELAIPEGSDTIIFKFVGYDEFKVAVNSLNTGNNELNVELVSSNVGINTVVVSASKRREKVLDAPASVSVITADKITTQAPVTVVDNLKYTPGVDIMMTGLVQSNVNIRGFNNIFSGAMLTIVDNRIARVPSLRVNAFQLIPTNSYDIDRMEIVRGPGSALYGPNASDGVLAIFTRSPLDMEKDFETTVSISGGTRMLFKPEIRHAGKITDKFGYKISASYTQADDFEYYDPREPSVGDTVYFGTVRAGMPFERDTTIPPTTFDRDFHIQNYSADLRFDWRPTDDIDIVWAGGFATLNNIELTGLGAGQGINWRSYYGQMRFRWRNLFVQYFINGSNAGDTYLIPQVGENATPPHEFQLLVDKSKLHTAQIQHNWQPISRLDLTYGLDMLLTTPETEGTINGRFEDDDNILQLGGYVQGEVTAHEKLKFVGALRVDYHNRVDGAFVSPRVAMVYKPLPRHTIRLTYNRAFSSPTSLNLFLDLSNGLIPNGINIRGIGNANGYNYMFGDNGLPQFRSSYVFNDTVYNPDWYDVGDRSDNYKFFEEISDIIGDGLKQIAPPNLQAFVPTIISSLLTGIGGETGTIQDVGHVTVDYVKLLETGNLNASQYDISQFESVPGVQNSVTQTVEAGYKGIIADRLFAQVDFYYTRISDYVGPLTLASASVMFNQEELLGAIGGPGTVGQTDGGLLWNNLESSPFNSTLIGALDGAADYQDPTGTIAPISGSVYDEIAFILLGASRQIPIGSVTPDDELIASDVILTYVNLGTINIGGMDLGLTYQATDEVSFSANYSWVDKDRIPLKGAQGGYVALNAPKHKTSVSAEYNHKELGISARLAWRWTDGFPANSAVYVGDVKPGNFVDLNAGYKLKFSGSHLQFVVDVNNLLNYKFQRFPGTPPMGTIVVGKVAYTF